MNLIFSASQILTASLMLFALGANAEPLPAGFGKIEVGAGTNAITVFTYKPKNYNGGPLVVVFHGMLRNAETYCSNSVALAERYQVLIAAPLFETNRFPNGEYGTGAVLKQGVLQPREDWIFSRVPKIVQTVRSQEGRPGLPVYYFGHSGGGQFAMRMAAILPTDAVRIVAANPGSVLFPRRDWHYGYGFGKLPPGLSDDAALQRYLAAPLTFYLGLADNDPNHSQLDRSAAAGLQGGFRLERGRNCFYYAQKLAQARGWKFNWRKVEVTNISHDGQGMLAAEAATDALFSKAP